MTGIAPAKMIHNYIMYDKNVNCLNDCYPLSSSSDKIIYNEKEISLEEQK